MRSLKHTWFLAGMLWVFSIGWGSAQPPPGTVHIGLTGDVMLGRMVNTSIERFGPQFPWGDTIGMMLDTDLNIINLETTLTTGKRSLPKRFTFKSDPRRVDTLLAAGVDICNLANNHILDFDSQGLKDTIGTLNDVGIQHVGAGQSAWRARDPIILEVNGVLIGVLGCTDTEPGWLAQEGHPGTYYVNIHDPDALLWQIRRLRPDVDILVLSMHWGRPLENQPSVAAIRFAHEVVDAGVDIFHGHGSHLCQSVEVYRDKLILYGTGDYIDDYYVYPDERNDQSFFHVVKVDRDGVLELRMVPVLISRLQVNRAYGYDRRRINHRMQQISQPFGTRFHEESGNLVIAPVYFGR